jgi:hypothetical protein
MRLSWADGVLMPHASEQFSAELPGDRIRRSAVDVFLDELKACITQGVNVSHAIRAGNYAPKVIGKRPAAKGCSKDALEEAMHILISDGRVKVVPYGYASKNFTRLELA